MDVPAQAGVAAPPVDGDDAVLVQRPEVALGLPFAVAEVAGEGGVGHAQDGLLAPAVAGQ
jgi:hypothetical protein